MNDFLLYSAGVNPRIIEKCPSQKTKFMCIGAAVLGTAMLAWCSGAFAYGTVFGNTWAAILFGFFWGFGIIYNLDRLFLASIRAHEKWYIELLAALPRLVLAALLAIVISKPLELYIFRSEIEAELTAQRNQAHLEAKRQLDNAPAYRDEINNLENDNQALRSQIAQARTQSQEAYEAAFSEGQNSIGYRPVMSDERARARQLDERLQNITRACETQIQHNDARIADLERHKASRLAAADRTQQAANGLLARIRALHALCDKDTAMGMADLALMLIFLAIEMAPLTIKVLGAFNKRRPYERLLDAEEAQEEATAQIDLTEAESRIATESAIIRDQHRVMQNAQTAVNKKIEQAVIDGQTALAQDVVRMWVDQQRDLLQHDPQQFFKTI